MSGRKHACGIITAVLCLVILIMDPQTALSGANAGMNLCFKSIIPTLLPFCILSKYICSALIGNRIAFLSPVGRITGMPKGSESILMLSLIGGYPLGAQCINDAYTFGSITKTEAERLLTFCNNAGPAFLFGILSCLFPTATPLWSLYIIHILSAIAVGIIVPGKAERSCIMKPAYLLSFTQTVEKSAKTVAIVSCWIIVFRIILEFISKWFIWILNPVSYSMFAGILELSNGCISLSRIDCLGLRYILCAQYLGFGGICVGMQTKAVAKHVPTKLLFPGKLLQAGISVFLASIMQYTLFDGDNIFPPSKIILAGLICVFFSLILFRKEKIMVAFAK